MKWTYQAEYVRCGKKCKGCPHGPYWYRYAKQRGRTVKQYVGFVHPEAENPAFPQNFAERDQRIDILDKNKATVRLACQILGISSDATLSQASKVWRQLVMLHHPDRGGDVQEFVLIQAAWTFLCHANDWH